MMRQISQYFFNNLLFLLVSVIKLNKNKTRQFLHVITWQFCLKDTFFFFTSFPYIIDIVIIIHRLRRHHFVWFCYSSFVSFLSIFCNSKNHCLCRLYLPNYFYFFIIVVCPPLIFSCYPFLLFLFNLIATTIITEFPSFTCVVHSGCNHVSMPTRIPEGDRS